jgi:hypothetical protein
MEGRPPGDDGTPVGLFEDGMSRRIAGALIAAMTIAILFAGCGGGGSSGSSSSAASTSKSDSTTASEGSNPAASEVPTGEPSKEFIGKGPNGKLAKVGKEASIAEREAASQVLEKSFTAGAEGDWATQCSTLASSLVKEIEKTASVLGTVGGCPKALEAQAAPLPKAVRESTMTGPIDALRVNQGINGFAFWHGTENKDYVLPLIKQNGWKLVVLGPQKAP